MSLRKTLFALGLALLSSALLASEGEPSASVAADSGAVETASASQIFGVSVLSSSRDCGAESQQQELGTGWICGACSVASCRGVELHESCGSAGEYCRNYPLNKTCGTDGPPKCVCSAGPIP